MDFSHIFVTSSFDWTIKLWSIKDQQKKCIHSFDDRNDSVFDVKWSPTNPALFASVDCTGNLDVWNINNDLEEPLVNTKISNQVAANKLRWNEKGNQISVADSIGNVHLYEVGDHISTPRNDEWNRTARTLNDIRNRNIEESESSKIVTTSGGY